MKHAFSLVELSIVLVILGLLTGGILTGQSLIRAAELRSITTEFQNYQTAVMTFRDKYFALPGDMTNAEAFWTQAHAADATCITTNSGTTATCNGDGNGAINVSTRSNERFRFWQHLANAGLVEGTYSGVEGTSGNPNDVVLGVNAPDSKLSNAGWHIISSDGTGTAIVFAGHIGNMFGFGGASGTDGITNLTLSTEETWNIDTKLDDGQPGLGKVIATRWNDCTDATANTGAATATYLLSETGPLCALRFINPGF